MILQKEIVLRARNRGFHLVTSEIVTQIPELQNIQSGILHVFIKHSSASLTLNENADPTVRNYSVSDCTKQRIQQSLV